MAIYKQIIYDFHDRNGTVWGDPNTESGIKLQPNTELVGSGKKWDKVGVQGSPGLRFRLNNESDFILGPSGIYELEFPDEEGINSFKIIDLGPLAFDGHYNIVVDYREV